MNLRLPKFRIPALRISLRAALLFVSLFCIALVVMMSRAKCQKETVQRIVKAGGSVQYGFAVVDPGAGEVSQSPWPSFLVETLGVDFFHSVSAIDLQKLKVSRDLKTRVRNSPGGINPSDLVKTLSKTFPDTDVLIPIVVSREQADELLLRIGKLEQCTGLMLNCNDLPFDLSPISKLSKLEILFLTKASAIDENEIAKLSGLKKIHTLRISSRDQDVAGSLITDESLKHISNLKGLKDLSISGADLTDEGIQYLSALEQLESCVLGQNGPMRKIVRAMRSKAGVPESNGGGLITAKSLDVFRAMPKHKRLGVFDTKISDVELDEFKPIFPK